MSKYIILYNPAAHGDHGLERAMSVEKQVSGECTYQDMTAASFSLEEFMKTTDPDMKIVLTGGDGTLNYLINSLPEGKPLSRQLYFYPGGSGNDFIRDLNLPKDCGPILINSYMENLPVMDTGKEHFRFFNGVGIGLDGYVCEQIEKQKKIGKEKSYIRTALEAIFRGYRPCDATVIVDGEAKTYQKVWMVPTMLGRFYGGGVKVAPMQDRQNPTHELTTVVCHNMNRLQCLLLFPFVKAGKGYHFPKHIESRTGHTVEVRLSDRSAIQVDGDVVMDRTEYRVQS